MREEEFMKIRAGMLSKLRGMLESEENTDDGRILLFIDQLIMDEGCRHYFDSALRERLHKELFNAVRRLDLLQDLVDDPEITEIMVNGPYEIFFEKEGCIRRWQRKFSSEEKLEDVIQQIVSGAGRQVNEASPIVDARLADGSRVNVVLKPVALNGPILTIRKFPDEPLDMTKMIGMGSVSEEAAKFLKILVRAKYNIFISGGTSTGKTTMLNALMDYVPSDERVITIEDSAELQIKGIDNLVKLEARNADADGAHRITIRELIKSSLRMRPDRLIIGEVRGAECLDMIQAMSSGHDGSICTGHAGSPQEMLSRIETMTMMASESLPLAAIRRQIASAVDIIIQLEKMRDRSRRVTAITEIKGFEAGEITLNPLFVFKEEAEDEETKEIKGKLVRCEHPLIHCKKLESAGLRLESGECRLEVC